MRARKEPFYLEKVPRWPLHWGLVWNLFTLSGGNSGMAPVKEVYVWLHVPSTLVLILSLIHI